MPTVALAPRACGLEAGIDPYAKVMVPFSPKMVSKVARVAVSPER